MLRPSVWALPKFPLSSALNRSGHGNQQPARDSIPDTALTHQGQDRKQAIVELAAERLLCTMVDNTGRIVVGRLGDVGIVGVESLGIGSCGINSQSIGALAGLVVGSHDDMGWRGKAKMCSCRKDTNPRPPIP